MKGIDFVIDETRPNRNATAVDEVHQVTQADALASDLDRKRSAWAGYRGFRDVNR